MWGYIAAAALPYVIGAMQKKPKQPGAPAQVVLPDRSQYIEQLLRDANNMNSGMYDQASMRVQEQVNRALARQGLAGSSVGVQAMIEGQNRVAQSFIDEKQRRMQAAMGVASNYDQMVAGVHGTNASNAYNYANDVYKQQLARQAAVTQGIGNMVNVGMQAYGADQWKEAGYGPKYAPQPSMYGGYNPAPIQYTSPSYGPMSSPVQAYQPGYSMGSNTQLFSGYNGGF